MTEKDSIEEECMYAYRSQNKTTSQPAVKETKVSFVHTKMGNILNKKSTYTDVDELSIVQILEGTGQSAIKTHSDKPKPSV